MGFWLLCGVYVSGLGGVLVGLLRGHGGIWVHHGCLGGDIGSMVLVLFAQVVKIFIEVRRIVGFEVCG